MPTDLILLWQMFWIASYILYRCRELRQLAEVAESYPAPAWWQNRVWFLFQLQSNQKAIQGWCCLSCRVQSLSLVFHSSRSAVAMEMLWSSSSFRKAQWTLLRQQLGIVIKSCLILTFVLRGKSTDERKSITWITLRFDIPHNPSYV